MSQPGFDMSHFESDLEQRVARVAESLGWYTRLEQRIGHSRYRADIILNNAQDFTGRHAVIEIKIGNIENTPAIVSQLWSIEHAVLRSLPADTLFIPLFLGLGKNPAMGLIKFAFPHAIFSTFDNLNIDLDKSLNKIQDDVGITPDPMDFVSLEWLEKINSGSKTILEFYSTMVAEDDMAIPIDKFGLYIQKYEKTARLLQLHSWIDAEKNENAIQLSDYLIESVEDLYRLAKYRSNKAIFIHGLPTYKNIELCTWITARHPNVVLVSWAFLEVNC